MNHNENLICKICLCEITDVKFSNDPVEVIAPCASVQTPTKHESSEQICSNCLGFEQIKIKTESDEIHIEETEIVNMCNSEEVKSEQEETQSETLPLSFIDVERCDNVKTECKEEDTSHNVCSEDYYTYESYKYDIRHADCSGEQRTTPYQCDICFKYCRHPSDLKRHLRTHTGEKPFKCDTCDRQFTQFDTLKRHKQIHTPSREKAYKCGVCSNVFYTSNDLKAHEKIHTGQRPFKCDICDKRFIRANHLTLHKQIHEPTREKSYKCDFCSKEFYTSGELRKHRKTHERNPGFSKKISIFS